MHKLLNIYDMSSNQRGFAPTLGAGNKKYERGFMAEQELKLSIPRRSKSSVEKELARGTVTRIPLRAMYFDTENRALVKAKVSLRLRQEGRHWVQTLKMPGEHALSRLELNHDRSGPILDLSVYVGTPAEPALASLTEPLKVCYETDIKRSLRKIRTKQGLVEVAYDVGRIRAGQLELPVSEIEFELMSGDLAAIFHLGKKWQTAFGLIYDARSKAERGDRLATLAGKLAATVNTPTDASVPAPVIDSSRDIAWFWAQRGINPIELKPEMSTATALSKVMTECLDQIARNAAMLAEVDTANVCRAGTPDHVHQLRVGIRRLRSAWSLFNGLTTLPPLALREEIKKHFAQLGGTRDDDVLRDTWLPVLEASGQPPIRLDSEITADNAAELCASRSFQTWLLDMLAWTIGVDLSAAPAAGINVTEPSTKTHLEPGATAPHVTSAKPLDSQSKNRATSQVNNPVNAHASPNTSANTNPHNSHHNSDYHGDDANESVQAQIIPLTPTIAVELTLTQTLSNKLKKWHRQVTREGLMFDKLDIESRHELRKRAKRLRYCLQFCESLLPVNRLKQYRKSLAVVQDVLGEMNDLAVASERFEGLKTTQPHAWFAVGWIAARLEVLKLDAMKAFKALSQAEHFWR